LAKTVLLVKPEFQDRVRAAFEGLVQRDGCPDGLRVVSSSPGIESDLGVVIGQRYLGVAVGSPEFRQAFVEKKTVGWVKDLRLLSRVANVFPHEAYHLLTHSIIARWRFAMRTTDVLASLYQPLEDALVESFFPAAFGWTPRDKDLRRRSALPGRHGGLAIPVPSELAAQDRATVKASGGGLSDAILAQDWDFSQDLKAMQHKRDSLRQARESESKKTAKALLSNLDGRAKVSLQEALDSESAGWLERTPIEGLGLCLDKQTFRDAIALKMGVPLPDPLPANCPSCHEPSFDVRHALKCKSGGWVRRRHDEVKYAWGTLFKKVSTNVGFEPYLPSCDGVIFEKKSTTRDRDSRADILVGGLFQRLQDAYLDVAVMDTGAECYSKQSPSQALKAKENRKRGKYEERARLAGTFAPLVCSVYGTLAPEASSILSRVVNGLDTKRREKSDTATMQEVYLQTAIVKATSMCLRSRGRPVHPECDARPGTLDDPVVAAVDTNQRE
jgi:hypothetical protein